VIDLASYRAMTHTNDAQTVKAKFHFASWFEAGSS